MSSVSAYEHLTNYVNDFANLLSPEEENQLNQMFSKIEKSTSVEIAIVTVQTTSGEARVEYASHLLEENGVGKKATDNGVVVLWTVDNEHGGAIATGRGIESILTDSVVADIGRSTRPQFDQGKYYVAFATILDRINTELHKQPSEFTIPVLPAANITSVAQGLKIGNMSWLFISIVLFAFIITIFSKIGNFNDSSDSDHDPKDDLPKRFPKAFMRNYKIIKKDAGKYYKRNKVGVYSILSAAMLLYLWNRWQDKDDDDHSTYGSIGRLSSYISSSSSSSGWSGGGGGFGGFGGGSAGGGGASF